MARESLGKMVRADSPVDDSFLRVYNRPVYVKGGMSGIPTEFLGSAGKNVSDDGFNDGDLFLGQESLLENYSLGKSGNTLPSWNLLDRLTPASNSGVVCWFAMARCISKTKYEIVG